MSAATARRHGRRPADALHWLAAVVSFTARAALLITIAMPALIQLAAAFFPAKLQVST